MLAWTEIEFKIQPADIDESIKVNERPLGYVQRLAREKTLGIINRVNADDFVLAADTIVIHMGKILGKPTSPKNAVNMLQELRGQKHLVITAFMVSRTSIHKIIADRCITSICMRNYSKQEILNYVDSGDPLDKAGGYAIQNPQFNPVVGFKGCFASVMGLPLCHLERALRQFPEYEPRNMAEICQNNLEYTCPIHRLVLAGEDIG